MQDLRYAGPSCGRREAGKYVCCWCGFAWGVEGGGGLSVRRHSYRGHRVEVWKTADCTKEQIHLKVKQRRQLVDTPGFIRSTQEQFVLDEWRGSWGVFFS